MQPGNCSTPPISVGPVWTPRTESQSTPAETHTLQEERIPPTSRFLVGLSHFSSASILLRPRLRLVRRPEQHQTRSSLRLGLGGIRSLTFHTWAEAAQTLRMPSQLIPISGYISLVRRRQRISPRCRQAFLHLVARPMTHSSLSCRRRLVPAKQAGIRDILAETQRMMVRESPSSRTPRLTLPEKPPQQISRLPTRRR